jgi:hypothetical protein
MPSGGPNVSICATMTVLDGGTPVYREQITRDNGGRISQRIETVSATTTAYD